MRLTTKCLLAFSSLLLLSQSVSALSLRMQVHNQLLVSYPYYSVTFEHVNDMAKSGQEDVGQQTNTDTVAPLGTTYYPASPYSLSEIAQFEFGNIGHGFNLMRKNLHKII